METQQTLSSHNKRPKTSLDSREVQVPELKVLAPSEAKAKRQYGSQEHKLESEFSEDSKTLKIDAEKQFAEAHLAISENITAAMLGSSTVSKLIHRMYRMYHRVPIGRPLPQLANVASTDLGLLHQADEPDQGVSTQDNIVEDRSRDGSIDNRHTDDPFAERLDISCHSDYDDDYAAERIAYIAQGVRREAKRAIPTKDKPIQQ